MKKKLILSILILLSATLLNAATKTLFFNNEKEEYDVTDYIEYFVDKYGEFDSISIQNQTFIKPSEEILPKVGMMNDAVWLRLKIQCTDEKIKTYILNINNPTLDIVNFYEFRNDSIFKTHYTGEQNIHEIQTTPLHSFFYFLDSIQPFTTSTFYIQVKNPCERYNIPIKLISQNLLYKQNYMQDTLRFTIFGFLFLMIFIGYHLTYRTKEKVVLLGSTYTLFGMLILLVRFGYLRYILMPLPGVFVNGLSSFLFYMEAISGAGFCYRFMEFDNNSSSKNHIMICFKLVGISFGTLSLFVPTFIIMSRVIWPYFVGSLAVYIIFYTYTQRHNRQALLINIIGLVPFLICFISSFFNRNGIFDTNNIMAGWQYALPAQIGILAIGLIEEFHKRQQNSLRVLENKNSIIESQAQTLFEKNKVLERLNIATSNLDNGIAIFSKVGKILWYNKFFKNGHPEIIARNIAFASPNDTILENFDFTLINDKTIKEAFSKCQQTRQSMIFETTRQSGIDNNVIYIQNTITPIINKILEIDYYVIVETNITEIKKANKDREDLTQKISQMERLESIGKLAGGIAHDFNNLLTPILGFSEILLEDEEISQENKDDINLILTSAKRAKELVNQILVFSSYFKSKILPVNVNNIAIEVVDILSKSKIAPNVKIELQTAPTSAIIEADSTHIHQVIMNICKNAIQAINGEIGFIKINIEPINILPEKIIVPDKPANSWISICIADSGPGMTEEIRNKIFDPFFTTKKPTQGTGLGMSVVHGIIKQYNGTINIDSAPNKGTRMTIYFPRSNRKIEKEDITNTEIDNTTNQSYNILLLDDEENITKMLQKVISTHGQKVTTFNDSLLAMQEIEKNPQHWDLIITDQIMPHLTGYDLMQKTLTLKSNQKFILMSGYSEQIDKQKIEKNRNVVFLQKPVAPTDLLHQMKKLLTQKIE